MDLNGVLNQFANCFSYVSLMKPPTRELLNPDSYPFLLFKHRWTMSNASFCCLWKWGVPQNCYVHLRRTDDQPSNSLGFPCFLMLNIYKSYDILTFVPSVRTPLSCLCTSVAIVSCWPSLMRAPQHGARRQGIRASKIRLVRGLPSGSLT